MFEHIWINEYISVASSYGVVHVTFTSTLTLELSECSILVDRPSTD